MSVKIRLALTGRSHQISYRMVAQDTHSKRDGKFLEILGFLNEFQKGNVSKFDKPRIDYYLSKGATFTPSAKFAFENGKLPPKAKKVKPAMSRDQQMPETKPKAVQSAPPNSETSSEVTQKAEAAQTEEPKAQDLQPESATTDKTPAAPTNEPEKSTESKDQ